MLLSTSHASELTSFLARLPELLLMLLLLLRWRLRRRLQLMLRCFATGCGLHEGT